MSNPKILLKDIAPIELRFIINLSCCMMEWEWYWIACIHQKQGRHKHSQLSYNINRIELLLRLTKKKNTPLFTPFKITHNDVYLDQSIWGMENVLKPCQIKSMYTKTNEFSRKCPKMNNQTNFTLAQFHWCLDILKAY